ncbi:AraC family transcriptional regulator [Paenibacillus nanensis]|uniref:AraC family transcriptional regulator n=1 Tax=Paenibacillus nanensis TaxID=393251 RepID=A0A3A1UV79_9BACL|nr:helix-turn-helix transcriptional regulator [Paenibacillus nanensis]RIX52448.1 AraC family transcriptional regulator [Paenibacillus nanensis]
MGDRKAYLIMALILEGRGPCTIGPMNIQAARGELYVIPFNEADASFISGDEGGSGLRVDHCAFRADDLGMAAPLLPMKWRIEEAYLEEMHTLLHEIAGASIKPSDSCSENRLSAWTRFMDFLLSRPGHAELQTFEQDETPIRQALHFMGYRFMHPISIAEISKRVAMSTRHFQRTFKSITGKTYIQMLQEIRIRHSCGLLRFSRLSVQSIAEAVGIYDMNYFYRLFRSYCGMTPAAFRHRYHKLEA